jgi:hypothetical protein
MDAASVMPHGKWPSRWTYPDPDAERANAVWVVLKPARDHFEKLFGQPFISIAGENSKDTVTRIRESIMRNVIVQKPGPHIPGGKI